jgi:hypothetical protein
MGERAKGRTGKRAHGRGKRFAPPGANRALSPSRPFAYSGLPGN